MSKPTKRQQTFIENMANPLIKTQTEAYQLAYPNVTKETAMANSSRMLRNAKVLTAIQKRKQRAISNSRVTPEEVLGSAAFQMRSGMRDVLDDQGSYSFAKACETGAIDLLKRHKETTKTVKGKDGSTETTKTVEIEILTNQDGRKEVANYIGLGFANNQPSDALSEFVLCLIKNYQFTKENALEAVKLEYGEVTDIEALERIIDGALLETN